MDLDKEIKILETNEFKVDIYNQTIEVCDVEKHNHGWDAKTICDYDKTEKITVLFEVETIGSEAIVHESVHIAMFIFERIGINFDTDNHEHFAYLVEYVYSNLTKIAVEMQKKYRKDDKVA